MNYSELFMPNLRQIDGSFSPIVYAVGVKEDPTLTMTKVPKFPVNNDEFEHYYKILRPHRTLVHEISHLGFYLSTLWGYRLMRSINIFHGYLCEKSFTLNLPLVSMDWLSILSDLKGPKFEMVNRFLTRLLHFIEAINEFRPQELKTRSEISLSKLEVYVEKSLYAPISFMYPNTFNNESALRYINHIPREIHHLIFDNGTTKQIFYINSGLILESMGRLSEIYQIWSMNPNSKKINLTDLLFSESEITKYTALPFYLLHQNICNPETLLTTFYILADISLNYELGILQSDTNTITYHNEMKNSPVEQLPGATFIKLVEAAKEVGPIQNFSDIKEYYDALTNSLSMPSIETILKIGRQVMKSKREFMKVSLPYKMHYRFILKRKSRLYDYPLRLIKTKNIAKTMILSRDLLTLYNIDSGTPLSVFPPRIKELVLPQVLSQVVFSDEIECPLKKGVPFFCHSQNGKYDELCAFKFTDNNQVFECPADDLAMQYSLQRYLKN